MPILPSGRYYDLPDFAYLDRLNSMYLNSQGETMPTEDKQYIVVGPSGAVFPANHHTNLSSAEAEATRLARTHAGLEFTVYATVKSFKVEDKPVTVKVFV